MDFIQLVHEIVRLENWRREEMAGGAILHLRESGGRSQRVYLSEVQNDGAPFVRLTSIIGESDRITPEAMRGALSLNFRLPYGAFATNGEELVIVETLPLGTEPSAVAAAVRFLAQQADRYESLMFRTDEA